MTDRVATHLPLNANTSNRAQRVGRRSTWHGAVAALALLAAIAGCAPGGGSSARPAAEQVLRDMCATYRAAKTYADSGELRLKFTGSDGQPVTEQVPFAVSFARPNRVRIQGYRAMVASDGRKVRATIGDLAGQVLEFDTPATLTQEALYADESLGQALTAQIAGSLPQLTLLLTEDFLKQILEGTFAPKLLTPEKFEEETCDRVEIDRAGGKLIFWVSQKSHLLLRVDFPAGDLAKYLEQQTGTAVKDATLTAELHAAQVNRPIEDVAFAFEVPSDAKIVAQFDTRALVPGPPEPSKLLGSKIDAFEFKGLDGTPLTRDSLAGKIVIVDFWATWCEPCLASLPNLDAAKQKFAGNDKVLFLAVSIDRPDIDDAKLREAFDKIKVGVTIARDHNQAAFQVFGIEGIPNLFVLGPDGTVEDNEVGFNPQLATELPTRIETLLAGESLHALARERYEERKREHEAWLKEPLTTATAASDAPAKAEIAPATEPTTLKLAKLWTAQGINQPGNILVIDEGPAAGSIFVNDGWNKVVELQGDGTVAATHDLNVGQAAVVSSLRTAAGADGRRWFVGCASAQRQWHLFDDAWKTVLSLPKDEAEVADVLLADLDGDEQLEVVSGYWGNRGIEVVSLAGEDRWKHASLENVFRLATTGRDAEGKRRVLAAHGRGTLVNLDATGQAGAEITVGKRFIRSIASADLDGDGQVEWCGLAPVDQVRDTLVGFALDGKELWTYELPPGLHQHPIEAVTGGRVGSTGRWIVASADGAIHVLAADGALVDRWTLGAAPCGIATATINGQAVLLISTTEGLTAWSVTE
ncbi:MAG: redoxin domain-containing protein [Pirellulales bacterium]|nr:redoxin domain-containing protein [Pirellulales bacterium]